MIKQSLAIYMGQCGSASIRVMFAHLEMLSRKTSVSCSTGINIVLGMPEQTMVVFRLIPIRVINVYVPNVGTELIAQKKPVCVSGANELEQKCIQAIVLVIVMGNQSGLSGRYGFVIGMNFSEMSATRIRRLFPFCE